MVTKLSKPEIREASKKARSSRREPDLVSRTITDRLTALPEYQAAASVCWYVDVRDEVRTRHAISTELAAGKNIAVPYCVGDMLHLFRLQTIDELKTGSFGVMEPIDDLRRLPERLLQASELDLVVVPGVAFDRSGGRLGYGKGYYDRLLANVRSSTTKIGLAFECQIFDSIPTEPHDILMNKVITEQGVFDADVPLK